MKIYLIRHGQTTGDLEDRYGGDYEDHLSEEGKKQAEILADKLKDKGIEIIFYSPRIRSKETTKIINKKLNAKTKEVYDFRERNAYGVMTGLRKTEANNKYPKEVAKIKKDKLNHKVKNSERYTHFRERIMKSLTDLSNSNYDTIAIITHGGPISCIIREVLRLGELKKIDDCAIIEIDKKHEYGIVNMDGATLENELI